MNETVLTFVATFGGVIASFLLWFGGEHWIKWRQSKSTLKAMKQEIKEEVEFNIRLLDAEGKYAATRKPVPEFVPMIFRRLNTVACSYAISSGELRLLRNRRKERIIYLISLTCSHYNHFVENTEQLLPILLLKNDGAVYTQQRLNGLADVAKRNMENLDHYLKMFLDEKLPDDDVINADNQK